MEIKINGKAQTVMDDMTIQVLVEDRGLDAGRIVIEYNYTIIPREKWGDIIISDEDNIEIVSFVGGG